MKGIKMLTVKTLLPFKNSAGRTLAFLGLGLVLSACNLSLAQDLTPPPNYQPPVPREQTILTGVFPITSPDPIKGAAIFSEKCQPCHGDGGLGDGPQAGQLPIPVGAIGTADLARQSSPQRWFSIVTLGKLDSFMPPFSGSLKEQDRWDVLSYVYTLSTPPEVFDAGKAVYDQYCAACHGEDGSGGEAAPEVDFTNAEEMVAFSGQDILAYIDPEQADEDHIFADTLSEEDTSALAMYVRSFVFPLTRQDEFQAFVGDDDDAADAEDPDAPAGDGEPADTGEGDTADPDAGEAGGEDSVFTGVVTGHLILDQSISLPENAVVELFGFDHFEQAQQLSAEVSADGSYRFEDLVIVPERVYFVSMDIEGMVYRSEFVIAQEGQDLLEIPLTVYGTTSEIDDLSVPQLVTFFEFPAPEIVQVVQWYSIVNEGDRAVVPTAAGDAAVKILLPEGVDPATLTFQDGALGTTYVGVQNGFGLLTAIQPGQTVDLVFGFQLPYDKKLTYAQPVSLSPASLLVLVSGESISLDSDQVTLSGTRDFNEQVYQVYTGEFDSPDLLLTLSGRHPSAAGGLSLTQNLPGTLFGGLALVFTLFKVYYWLRPEDFNLNIKFKDEILEDILYLDEAFEAGEIDELEYRRDREILKKALRKIL